MQLGEVLVLVWLQYVLPYSYYDHSANGMIVCLSCFQVEVFDVATFCSPVVYLQLLWSSLRQSEFGTCSGFQCYPWPSMLYIKHTVGEKSGMINSLSLTFLPSLVLGWGLCVPHVIFSFQNLWDTGNVLITPVTSSMQVLAKCGWYVITDVIKSLIWSPTILISFFSWMVWKIWSVSGLIFFTDLLVAQWMIHVKWTIIWRLCFYLWIRLSS